MRGNNILKRLSVILAVILVLSSVSIATPANAAEELPFNDIQSGKWYYDAVKYVYQNNLMTGLNDKEFGPTDNVTRAMVVNILWRMSDSPAPESTAAPFKDVPAGKWYTKAVAWAKENKVVNGYTNGIFGPSDYVSRQDFCIILKNYADCIGVEIEASAKDSYTLKADAKEVSGYAK